MVKNKKDSGILKLPNGDEYHGKFDPETQKFTGYSEMRFKNGDWYHGDFKNGVIEGQGVMRYKNGNKFTGLFLNGKLHEGEMIY